MLYLQILVIFVTFMIPMAASLFVLFKALEVPTMESVLFTFVLITSMVLLCL